VLIFKKDLSCVAPASLGDRYWFPLPLPLSFIPEDRTTPYLRLMARLLIKQWSGHEMPSQE
jgi:hypothetical protein